MALSQRVLSALSSFDSFFVWVVNIAIIIKVACIAPSDSEYIYKLLEVLTGRLSVSYSRRTAEQVTTSWVNCLL